MWCFRPLVGPREGRGDVAMHACSWYCGSEVLGCRTLRLESESSAGLRMQPYPRSLDLVPPGHLHGTGCLSARAMDTGFPTAVWCLCLGLGFAVTPPILAGVLGGCAWVRALVSPLHSWLGFVVCAVGLGLWLAPRHSWLGFWGVRGCVRAPPVPRRSWLGSLLILSPLMGTPNNTRVMLHFPTFVGPEMAAVV